MRNLNQELAKLYPADYAKLNVVGYFGGAQPSASSWDFEEPFTDDQSTLDARWSKTGTLNAPNATTDEFDWDGTRTTTLHGCSADPMGATIDDTAWVMRYEIVADSSTAGTYSSHMFLVLSSTDHASGSEASQDALGMSYRARTTDPRHPYQIDSLAESLSTGATTKYTTTFSDATTYYEELIRLTATSFRYGRFSDSGFSTSIETNDLTVDSGIDSLRYIKFTNFNATAVGSDNFNGTADNIQFADGVTTAPT